MTIWLCNMGLGLHNADTQDPKNSEPGSTPYHYVRTWYVRNDTQHTDLNMTNVAMTIDKTYTKLHLTMNEHNNPLIQDKAQHLPPSRIARRLKRRHHTNNLEPTDK
jgi:hypothetical protein